MKKFLKKILILIGLFVSLYSFSQDLKYTNPRKVVNEINYSNKGNFNILNYGATEGGTGEDATAIQKAINAGTNVSIDFLGTAPDMGAKEIR